MLSSESLEDLEMYNGRFELRSAHSTQVGIPIAMLKWDCVEKCQTCGVYYLVFTTL